MGDDGGEWQRKINLERMLEKLKGSKGEEILREREWRSVGLEGLMEEILCEWCILA